ncbi:cytotoxic T-lymphocyte protein 4-like [Rhincodon typus]|uniref:cytotoxic T-lymphocyte protein 4-like n=1 Tax=Rhincodon typus TaxID=259920 RepID=UPI00202F0798|nr:cytotoxic T-lymphocyte protein 4-like [Rhincodon typus]
MERVSSLGVFILCLSAAVKLKGSNMGIFKLHFVKANHSGEASLACGFDGRQMGEEFQVVLYKGMQNKDTEVCTTSFINGTIINSVRKGLYHCQVSLSQNNVSITIRGLNVTDTDRYICQVLKTHPPPFHESAGQWTIIYINQAITCPEDVQATGGFLPTIILIVLAALLLLYSTSLTLLYCKHKMKDDTIYINVRK